MRDRRRIDCPVCHAAWDRRTVRFCGVCGALLPRRGHGSAAGRPAPMTLVGPVALIAAIGLVATLVAGSTTGPGAVDEVTLPDAATDLPAELGRDAGASWGGTANDCAAVAACTLWRIELDARPVAHDGLLVHLGRDDLAAYHAFSGEERWRQEHAEDRGVRAPVPDVVHPAGRHGLLLHGEGWLQLRDAERGEHLWTSEVDGWRLSSVEPHADGLLVAGSRQDTRGAARQFFVAALDPGSGAVVWEHDAVRGAPHAALEEGVVLVRTEDGRTLAVESADGRVRWERAHPVRSLGRVVGETPAWMVRSVLVATPAPDAVEIVDAATGAAATVVDMEPGSRLDLVGPWLAIDGRRLHDLGTGEVVVELEQPVRAWRRTGSQVLLATPDLDDADRLLVAAHRAGSGSLRWQAAVPGSWGCCPSLSLLDQTRRLLVGDRGGSAALLDTGSGELLGAWTVGVEPAAWLQWQDGLAIEHRHGFAVGPAAVRVHGPGGRVELDHPAQVISTAPLVVHGAGVLTRVDDGFLREGRS